MKDHLINLLDYELWANRQVIKVLELLSNVPEQCILLMSHIPDTGKF